MRKTASELRKAPRRGKPLGPANFPRESAEKYPKGVGLPLENSYTPADVERAHLRPRPNPAGIERPVTPERRLNRAAEFMHRRRISDG